MESPEQVSLRWRGSSRVGEADGSGQKRGPPVMGGEASGAARGGQDERRAQTFGGCGGFYLRQGCGWELEVGQGVLK